MEFIRGSAPAARALLRQSIQAPLLCPWEPYDDANTFFNEILNKSQSLCQDMIYQGLPMMVGVIIQQSGEFNVDSYLEAMESLDEETIALDYSLFKKQIVASMASIAIPEEISSIQVSDSSFIPSASIHRMRLPISSTYKYGAIMIYRVVVFQVPKHHINTSISMRISIDVILPSNQFILRNPKEVATVKEQTLPQLSVDIIILNPIQVNTVSVEDSSSCGSIWNISVKNSMKTIVHIHNLLINLKSSVRLDNRVQGDDEVFDDINLGEKQYVSSSYGGSAREGQSAIVSDASSDSVLFNYANSSNPTIDCLFVPSPIISSVNAFPISLPVNGTYSFAYSVKMKSTAFLKANLDDLAAQYLTPFTLYWSTKFWENNSNTSSKIIPCSQRIYWSVGLKNLEQLQVLRKDTASLSSGVPSFKLVESITLSIKCQSKVALNIPTTIQLIIENRSSSTLHQLVVSKKTYSDTYRNTSNSLAQYYILEHADPIRYYVADHALHTCPH